MQRNRDWTTGGREKKQTSKEKSPDSLVIEEVRGRGRALLVSATGGARERSEWIKAVCGVLRRHAQALKLEKARERRRQEQEGEEEQQQQQQQEQQQQQQEQEQQQQQQRRRRRGGGEEAGSSSSSSSSSSSGSSGKPAWLLQKAGSRQQQEIDGRSWRTGGGAWLSWAARCSAASARCTSTTRST